MNRQKRNKRGQFVKGMTPWNRGKNGCFGEQTLKKMSSSLKGRKAWNKGKAWSLETRRKMSEAGKRKVFTKQHRVNISRGNLGKKHSKEWNDNVAKAIKGKTNPPKGEKHYNWKGGITPVTTKIRESTEYARWRQSVFERDQYTCVICGRESCLLHADHRKPFSFYVDEIRLSIGPGDLYENAMAYEPLWDIENGRTLCEECHRKTDTFAGRIRCL